MFMKSRAPLKRRELLSKTLIGSIALAPLPAVAATRAARFDRAAYDRYIQLMNKGDLNFIDYYSDDVSFVMNIRGKKAVWDFYIRQQPYVMETLEVLFFCSDRGGAAAQILSKIQCVRNCDDPSIFGRNLVAGEVQLVRGCLLYGLNSQGKIAEIKGPPPEILQPWHSATA